MTILLNLAVIIICLSFIYYLFLLLNGLDSPFPVFETQVLVLLLDSKVLVLVLVLDTKDLVLVLVLDTKDLVLVLVLASKVFKVLVLVLVLVPQVLDLVLVLATKVLVNITVWRPLVSVITTLLCYDYYPSSSVVSRAFSAPCMYSKFGHHPHAQGHLCAKFCFFCGLHC